MQVQNRVTKKMQTPQRLEEKNGSTETLIYNLSRRQHTKNIRIYMYTQ